MKVILFLKRKKKTCQRNRHTTAQTHTQRVFCFNRSLFPNVPNAIARSKVVLKVIDGISTSLANNTLVAPSAFKFKSSVGDQHAKNDALEGKKKKTDRFALGSRIDQLLAKVLPVFVGGGILNDNLLEVIGELEDDVLVLLGQLQVIVGLDAFLRNGCSGGGRAC